MRESKHFCDVCRNEIGLNDLYFVLKEVCDGGHVVAPILKDFCSSECLVKFFVGNKKCCDVWKNV